MQKILPHFWYDTQAKEAAAFYVTLFPNSEVVYQSTMSGSPHGDFDIVSFKLAGQDFMAIAAGPFFKFNPAISMFVTFDSEAEIEKVYKALVEGGKELMPYDTYPWAQKYVWLEDKYGLTWQLSVSEHHQMEKQITPLLMFTKDKSGKAKEAIEEYTKIFPNSNIELTVPYEKGDNDTEGFIKHARFNLEGVPFMAMDSSGPHEFVFNEAVSFVVNCDDQAEIDYYWDKLSADPESEQCGWIKDRFGVSWQIVPRMLNDLMVSGETEKIKRVNEAVLKMKKLDIATIEKAYKGE